MISILPRRTDSPRFRLRWLGYDRAQVDAFLRQTAADRIHLQDELAKVHALMATRDDTLQRQLEQLATLRTEVMNCLGASVSALRTAEGQLSSSNELAPATPQGTLPDRGRRPPASGRLSRPARQQALGGWLSLNRRHLLTGAVPAAGLMLLVLIFRSQPGAGTITAAHPGAARHDAPPAAELPTAAPKQDVSQSIVSSAPAIPHVDGLLLTLSARVPCWIRTIVDGDQPLERLLKADETIMVRATNEVVLRVGNAAALAMLINGQPAKPLGAPGQVAMTRITRTNYPAFLARAASN